jgi:hypothetical protein
VSKETIVPVFSSEFPDHTTDDIREPWTIIGLPEDINEDNLVMVEKGGGCFTCKTATLKMSIDGTKFYTMDEVKEALRLYDIGMSENEENNLPVNFEGL